MQDGAIDTLSPRENLTIGEARLWRNFDARTLYQLALRRGEGRLTRDGAIAVDTGEHTGRSPKDKYIVRDETTERSVDWHTNAGMSRAAFERLRGDVLQHIQGRQLFVQDLFAGADPAHQIDVTVYTEFAWHALFIRNLLIREATSRDIGPRQQLTILAVPSFRADPQRYGVRSATVIACDFSEGVVIIAGTSYAGEMKKAVFTYLNYVLPERGVMPMHCSANIGRDGDVAVFFGLSGTGKTTLSASADRTLIGDDEHGWGRDGVFNFEGGCYAKAINLSFASEPQIYSAANRFGAVLENVAVSEISGEPNFHDASRTENTRAAYPLDFISNASSSGRGTHPKNIVMLTADAFGVLPPIARLTPEQAIYHFLSGFTAKVSGTEKGVRDPEPTFSTCFGAPFMPRAAIEYGTLLGELVREHKVSCWLVNTGWSGGPFGIGKRMRLDWTRALLDAALSGALDDATFRVDEWFGFEVPLGVPDVPATVLDPRGTWADGEAFDRQAGRLAKMFTDNFGKFAGQVDPAIRAAGPRAG
ncbi:MAG TPA: phosphoenolpyruvate carboxykinase [Bauldia sp.]|nr:phosphoenolpyruvate carboxykinase [Bauldia sp.]